MSTMPRKGWINNSVLPRCKGYSQLPNGGCANQRNVGRQHEDASCPTGQRAAACNKGSEHALLELRIIYRISSAAFGQGTQLVRAMAKNSNHFGHSCATEHADTPLEGGGAVQRQQRLEFPHAGRR